MLYIKPSSIFAAIIIYNPGFLQTDKLVKAISVLVKIIRKDMIPEAPIGQHIKSPDWSNFYIYNKKAKKVEIPIGQLADSYALIKLNFIVGKQSNMYTFLVVIPDFIHCLGDCWKNLQTKTWKSRQYS